MAKLSLAAAPTFKAKVGIPVAGGDAVPVEMVFKHRTKKQLDEFIESRKGKGDTESFMEMVVGWDLVDEFNADNVEMLLQNYIGAALETYRTYIDQLFQGKLKN